MDQPKIEAPEEKRKDKLREHLQRHFPLEDILVKKETGPEALPFNRFRVSRKKQMVLAFLKISPWLCGLGLLISFLPLLASSTGIGFLQGLSFLEKEFVVPALQVLFFDGRLVPQDLLRIVSIGGLIGYGTNWLAIRMLFRPVEKRPIWGQGLIPAQRDRIIFTLAKGMHKHVLNQELIRKRMDESGIVKRVNKLLIEGGASLMVDERLKSRLKAAIRKTLSDYFKQEAVRSEIRQMIDLKLDESLEGGLKRFMLTTYKRINQADYEALIQRVISDLPRTVVHVLDRFDLELERAAGIIRSKEDFSEKFIMDTIVDLLYRIDITDLLRKQMEHFDEAKLERMVWEATNEQLLFIQYLGTILGVFGGMLIWAPETMAILYVFILGFLWILDTLIFRLKKQKLAD